MTPTDDDIHHAYKLARRVCYQRRIRRVQLCEDATQHAMLGFLGIVRRYDPAREPSFWRFAVWQLSGYIRSYVNRDYVLRRRQYGDDGSGAFSNRQASGNVAFDNAVLSEQFEQVCDYLPVPEQSLALLLAADWTYEQIGQLYGVSKQCIGQRVTKMRERIRCRRPEEFAA